MGKEKMEEVMEKIITLIGMIGMAIGVGITIFFVALFGLMFLALSTKYILFNELTLGFFISCVVFAFIYINYMAKPTASKTTAKKRKTPSKKDSV